jgi:cytoskeleton protein RodZ
MMKFGGRLRAARERRGISLRQVAASTKIPSASLEALERDDVARLPEGIFRRAIVRAYAAEIGLPPEETLREFLAHHEPPPPQTDEPDVEQGDVRQRMAAVVVGVVVLSVLLAAGILLLTSRREPHVPSPAAAVSAPAPRTADDGSGGDEEQLEAAPAPATDAPGSPTGVGEASRIE